MTQSWRVVDTGLRSAPQNIALSRALLEARQADEIPNTIRFGRYGSAALLACEESGEQALDEAYCARNGIAIQRRLSGGSSWYVDDRQLTWDLYLDKKTIERTCGHAVAKHVCHAVAVAVSASGVDARYRAPNEIEIDARKVGACAVTTDTHNTLIQGFLFVDVEVERVARAIRAAALPRALVDRLTDVRRFARSVDVFKIKHDIVEAFESAFEMEARESDLTLSEEARYRNALSEIDSSAWVHLVKRPANEMPRLNAIETRGAETLDASVLYDVLRKRIRQVAFCVSGRTTDARALFELEATLADTPVEHVARKVEYFFTGRAATVPPFTPADIAQLVLRALKQPLAGTR